MYSLVCFNLFFFCLFSVISLLHNKDLNKKHGEKEEEEQKESEHFESKETDQNSLKAMLDIISSIQDHLAFLAHLLESVKNVFNFTVPFLSWLAFAAVFIVTIALYFVPLRFLLTLWGTNLFLIKPWTENIDNLTNFISRVPDDEQLKNFEEISTAEANDKKTLVKRRKIGQ